MIKLIGFDLDDTLLNSEKKIDDLDVLSSLHQKGIRLCLVSGRPLVPVQIEYYKQLKEEDDAYFVGYNGATIYKLNGEIIYRNHLSNDEVKTLYSYLRKVIDDNFKDNNIAICLHTNDCLYSDKSNWAVDYDYKVNGIRNEITDFSNVTIGGPKLMIDGDVSDMEKLWGIIYPTISKEYSIIVSMPCYIEILHKDVNKYVGLDIVRELYNIKRDEAMAFGDSGNDLEMIRDTHIGVCMANGRKEVKEVADYITEDNDHHGIVNALHYYKVI